MYFDSDSPEAEIAAIIHRVRKEAVAEYRETIDILTAKVQVLEDRINGVDRDYRPKRGAALTVSAVIGALHDEPHWEWQATGKSYAKEMPREAPSGEWIFRAGGPMEQLQAEMGSQRNPFYKLIERARKEERGSENQN